MEGGRRDSNICALDGPRLVQPGERRLAGPTQMGAPGCDASGICADYDWD